MRNPSPYAGETATLRADAREVGGQRCDIVDWYERLHEGASWRDRITVDPRAEAYSMRAAIAALPDDDAVLQGRLDGMTMLIHVTEINGYVPEPPASDKPSQPDKQAVGQPCPGCGKPIQRGDPVAKLAIGPGADPQARGAAKAGKAGWACVYVDVHWACRTGDESYESEV